MGKKGLLPEGEQLRRAVAWLAERHDLSLAAIEEACRQFDLSPADEEFLLRHFLGGKGGSSQ